MSSNDRDTTLQELKNLVAAFRDERSWGSHHSPKNLAMSIAIEAAELMEHFQWDEYGEEDKKAVADELADIVIYCMNFADTVGIDVATSFRDKLKRAELKYPVATFNAEHDDPADYVRIKKAYRSKKGEIMTPDQYTNQEFFLDVGDGHTLYVQDWGKADAKKPILFLHGGPGAGVKDRYRQQFDPTLQRVIFFDQRGCGKSTPYGSLENNTTDDLIEDIEKIAVRLKLDQFIITGGSWGSCLALAYGLKYPGRVSAMVLRGIFTGRQSETDWIEQGGFRTFFPDVWDSYIAGTPPEHVDDPSTYHVSRILGKDVQASTNSAYLYGNVEGSLMSLDDRFTPSNIDEFDPTLSKLEAHYLSQTCFMSDGYIIENAAQLTMPIWLIQDDMVCPPITAYELSKQLPDSHLIWTTAGHGNDRANYDVNRTILLELAT